jgi:putative transposase
VTQGLHRYYGHHDLHFITSSCYDRQPQLGTALRRDLFLEILEETRRKYRFVVHGYVVMPEHFHLLITEPELCDPSVVMKVLKHRFARGCRTLPLPGEGASPNTVRQSTERCRPDRVWQKRFYDFNVWTERKRIEKLRYMHRNPVTRGLVAEQDQWKWSSFRSYLCGEPGLVRVNAQEWLLEIKRRPPRDGARPVAKLSHSFAKSANEWATRPGLVRVNAQEWPPEIKRRPPTRWGE